MARETGSADGLRTKRASGTIALLVLLALGVCASTASAAPLSMTFTEARANVGIQLSATNDDDALLKAPNTAPFEAQIDPGSGLIADGALEVPDFTTFIEDDPVDADVTVEFEIGIINGSFSQATGALVLSGKAGGTLTANGKECTISTDPPTLTLSTVGSTGGPSPLFGAPFTAGLTGAGAIAGQWNDMDAKPVDPEPGGDTAVCETVDDHIGGPGGIWLEQEGDVAPPSAPTSDTRPKNDGPPPPPPPACIVPELVGMKLTAAKRTIKAAGCKVGTVRRPTLPKGKGRRALVVKSSNPAAGATPANGKVDVKLGLKHRK